MARKKKQRGETQSYRVTEEALEALDTLVQADCPFPLGKPSKPNSRVKWFEFSLAWLLAAALRREISPEQVDWCLSPADVFRLWVMFVKAKRGEEDYKFSSDNLKERVVVAPDGSEVKRVVFGEG